MLMPRIIPSLLIHNRGVVKTVKFKDPKYVGDPINAVRIFNEKKVDELIVTDIDATVQNRPPDFTMIGHLAAECRMPLCYGGGIRSVADAQRVFALGVEKVALSAAAMANPALVATIAEQVGRQSVIVVLDVRAAREGKYEVYTHNGRNATGRDAMELAKEFEELGAGEIVLNSIDRDGTMTGYDLTLVEQVRQRISIPMTILGGAGSLEHIRQLIAAQGIIGAAAGSLFVFKGPYKAVLINYPSEGEKKKLAETPTQQA